MYQEGTNLFQPSIIWVVTKGAYPRVVERTTFRPSIIWVVTKGRNCDRSETTRFSHPFFGWLLQRDTMVDLHNAGSIGIKGPKVQ